MLNLMLEVKEGNLNKLEEKEEAEGIELNYFFF
jgi:hypothetical protein